MRPRWSLPACLTLVAVLAFLWALVLVQLERQSMRRPRPQHPTSPYNQRSALPRGCE